MHQTRVGPLGGNPFAPGPAYQAPVSGSTTLSTTDSQCQSDDYSETPEHSPRGYHNSWREPQDQLLNSPNNERGGAEGAVLGSMGGQNRWCMPHHGSPTSLGIQCNGAKDAVWGPRGCQNNGCTPPHSIPTSQPGRHDSWCIHQCADGAFPVGYYMQVPMVLMIPILSRFAQKDPKQCPDANAPASGVRLQIETMQNRSAGSCHENVDAAQTTQDSAPPRANVSASREIPAGVTTLVIRNIPARYTQSMLLHEFGGPDGSFDFFYLPYSFRDSKTVGVAFINFRSHHAAVCFQEMWHRCFLWGTGRGKHLDVVAATIQGLVGNLKQFNPKCIARLGHVGKLPAFFDDQGNQLNSIGELRRHGVLP